MWNEHLSPHRLRCFRQRETTAAVTLTVGLDSLRRVAPVAMVTALG